MGTSPIAITAFLMSCLVSVSMPSIVVYRKQFNKFGKYQYSYRIETKTLLQWFAGDNDSVGFHMMGKLDLSRLREFRQSSRKNFVNVMKKYSTDFVSDRFDLHHCTFFRCHVTGL